ncbi:hypothetical protein GCM10027271_54780 [Saccharopolyspora gloriosae]
MSTTRSISGDSDALMWSSPHVEFTDPSEAGPVHAIRAAAVYSGSNESGTARLLAGARRVGESGRFFSRRSN